MLELHEEADGKILGISVSGKLTKKDYEHFLPEVERLIKTHGRIRVLFRMQDFHGWELGALWEDIKFDVRHFADIERVAIVGERKWQHGMAAFYDGHGSYSGRTDASGRSTRIYNGQGSYAGRIDHPKNDARIYDQKGSYAGRATSSGNGTSFYDSKGSYSGRSSSSGNTTQYYDGKGSYSGRAVNSGGTTSFYDSSGRFVGRRGR